MTEATEQKDKEFEMVTDLLGGSPVLRYAPKNTLEAHELLAKGLPARALTCLIDNLVIIEPGSSLEHALGMSWRTFQRRKIAPKKPLSLDQSGRTWKFAEILAKATSVFGSQEEAEQWLEQPAVGLEQRRPLDLLSTPAGVELVDRFLNRLEYGVYM
jgi:putative toxin-antitoxin system antitoxin component (TIGR02293 family)